MNHHPNATLLCDALASMGRRPSEADLRWEATKLLERTDPGLALLFRAEAIAGHRTDNNVCEAAKLPMIRDLLREVIELRTGRSFKNPLYP